MSGTNSPRRRKWHCDACGKTDYWSETWSWYGSIMHMETCPDDLPTACSDDCTKVMNKKIESGEWKIPELGRMGAGGANVVRGRIGY